MSTFRRLEVGTEGQNLFQSGHFCILKPSFFQVNGIPEERKVAEALNL